jgi:trehalose-6-phosphatase
VKVGEGSTQAQVRLAGVDAVREWLRGLADREA